MYRERDNHVNNVYTCTILDDMNGKVTFHSHVFNKIFTPTQHTHTHTHTYTEILMDEYLALQTVNKYIYITHIFVE